MIITNLLRTSLLLAGLALFCFAGCNSSDGEVLYDVKGTITYQDKPVGEGDITFEDPGTGSAATAKIQPDGTYSLKLPQGDYQIGITPPTIEIPATKNSPGDTAYKKVDNIPANYYYGHESGLTATISPDSTVADFDLK